MALAVSSLLVVATGRAARAAGASEDQLIRDGVEARRHQEDAKALDLFRQAYARHRSPRAAGQMGLAEVALGRWVEADAHLEEAMAAHEDPWVRKNRKTLESTQARVRQEIGMLEVLGPVGAELQVAGQARGVLPLDKPLHVRAGEVRFELRAAGRVTETRAVRVTAGQLTRETVDLFPLPVQPLGPVAGNEGASDRTNNPAVTTSRTETNGSAVGARPGAALRTTGVLLALAGVAAVGAGAALGLKARSAGRADSGAGMYDPAAEELGLRFQTLQWVGYGVGGALLVGGAVTYLLGATRRSASEPQMALVAAPGTALAVLEGTF